MSEVELTKRKQAVVDRDAAKPKWSEEITPEQLEAACSFIRADPIMGTTIALRKAGVIGSKGHIGKLLDDDAHDAITQARGRNIESLLKVLWEVAEDKEHPSWQRANALALKAFGGPKFRDRVEVTGTDGGAIQVEDRSATLQDVARVLEAVGALVNVERAEVVVDGSGDQLRGPVTRPALPAARPVLPVPPDR